MKKRSYLVQKLTDMPLRTQLIIAFLVVTFLSVGILAFMSDYSNRRYLSDAANRSLYAAASETALRLDSFFETNIIALETESQLPDFSELLNAILTTSTSPSAEGLTKSDLANRAVVVLSRLSRKDRENIISYGVLAKNGVNVADSNIANIGKAEDENDYFRTPVSYGYSYISPVFFLPDSNIPVFYISAPITNVAGKVIGVLRVCYKAAILQELVQEITALELAGKDSFAVLFDENQLYLAHGDIESSQALNYKLVGPASSTIYLRSLQTGLRLPSGDPESLSANQADLARKLSLAVTNKQNSFTIEDPLKGNRVEHVAVKELTVQPWRVAYFQPRDQFLQSVIQQRKTILVLALVIFVIVVIAAISITRFLTTPITQLTEVAKRVAGGDLEAQVPLTSKDEIGQLARAFNTMTSQLRQSFTSLERQIEARTSELIFSMEIGQKVASYQNIDDLLPAVMEAIRERFNLYYTHVYFVDDLGKNLILRAGTGEVGRQLLERRHTLPLGAGSIVGQVGLRGQSVVVSDTTTSTIHKPNPLLPDTRSELAVPLIIAERVIGVLDMQADKANTFTTANMPVFEALATQLSTAIDSATQRAFAKEAQQKAEDAIQQLSRENWKDTLANLQIKTANAFTYNLSQVKSLEEGAEKNLYEADENVGVPLIVQNQIIGRLYINMADDQPISEAQQALLQSVAKQLSQKVETLRLFEDTQRNAWRDRVVSEVTTDVWASAEIEDVMKTAVAHLGDKLRASEVIIRLGTEAGLARPEN